MKTKKTLNKALYNCMVKDFAIREYNYNVFKYVFKFFKLKDYFGGLVFIDKVSGNITIEWGQVIKSKQTEKLVKDFASAYYTTPEISRKYPMAMHLYQTSLIEKIKYSKQAIDMSNEIL